MTVTLATAGDGEVSMRVVAPVFYQGSILIFTAANSQKYRQLRLQPNCCIGTGTFFAHAAAEFRGATMLPENEDLRTAYCEKFPYAFAEGIEFGGRECEFILFHPKRLTGWTFEKDTPTEGGIPTIPFDIQF